MRFITFDDIREMNINPSICYNWVVDMIKNKNTAVLPPKTSLSDKPGMFCTVMPCILDDEWSGVKVVNRYPERQPCLDSRILLINNATGEFLAMMDANWITAMRTGAVATHSIVTLAKSNFSTIGMIGLGNTCRATLLMLLSVLRERRLHIKLFAYKGQEELFVNRFKDFNNIEFEFVNSYEKAVKGSDVVVSCITTTDVDLCSDDCFDEGVLVVPVHTRGFTNCDLFFDKVFADDTGHVKHFKNFDKFKNFAEVSDVVNGKVEGRTSNRERILAYNIGVATHDINFAMRIYKMMEAQGILPKEIDMKNPTEKFWI